MYTIYLIENQVNGKRYVGMTCQDPGVRFCSHKSAARNGVQTTLYHAMRKYGEENFSISEIDEAETEEEAAKLEQEWIAELNTYEGPEYNETRGGSVGNTTNGEDRHNTEYSNEVCYHAVEAMELYEVSVFDLSDRTGISVPQLNTMAAGESREEIAGRFADEHPRYTGDWSKVDDRLYEAARYALLNDEVSRREAAEKHGFAAHRIHQVCNGSCRPRIRDRFDEEYDYEPQTVNGHNLGHGEASRSAKLTEEDVMEMRKRYVEDDSLTTYDLGGEYGLAPVSIGHALSGESWSHLPMPDGMEEALDRTVKNCATGSDHHAAQLTEEEVLETRRDYVENDDIFAADIAEGLGVEKNTARRMLSGETWIDVPMPDGMEETLARKQHEGKIMRGEDSGQSDLSKNDVLEILRRYEDENLSHDELAKDYPVSESAIGHIIRRDTWTHIDVPSELESKIEQQIEENRQAGLANRQKLSDEEVRELRRKAEEPSVCYADLADEYGLSKSYVGSLVRGEYRADI